ncbi:MAG: tyrosinase family protein, partial [Eudoraea sp.]|nr:tyrosinase family protein [Eudoraea sp.]
MGIRKNAKFLSSTEKENFVRACVLMKADIVNPTAPAAQQYSVWDENVALHRMIQSGIAPGNIPVNFGHGGSGSYSFLSWHRYFLFHLEGQLQSYVAGVMIPYWDWTDPSPIMTADFLGPDGNAANSNIIEQGYFAVNRPGTGGNTTPLPAWWPASLNGWTLPSAFPSNWQGGLRRNTGSATTLPTSTALNTLFDKVNYPDFQHGLESGTGLGAFSDHRQMHNGMHGWIGGGFGSSQGHMSHPEASPFDPFFYLHHCNIDRLWAMWQADGHATEYPLAGGNSNHHRNDLMYPWVGNTPGYSTSASISGSIPMPDFTVLGPITNADTLDFRTAYNYTYDTLPVIGIGLDKTGSMGGMTPDPMVSTAPDVTKWEAAKRGVSLFLQDCETVQESGVTFVTAGVQTFRSILGTNQFETVFSGPGYGLIKNGTSFSQFSFDSIIAAHSPGGGTPLVDALVNVKNTLVDPPFGGVLAGEQRYIAMLTDGIRTSGSLFSSVPNGSLSPAAIFAMGFGTGADVDYTTLATMVAKGQILTTTQIFHGENAGTIDKFYSNALAEAIGFTMVFDPVLELFEGEHAHLHFDATSAEDTFLITAQGMDYQDRNWSYMLKGPSGNILLGHKHGEHTGTCHSKCCPGPVTTVKRSNGRTSIVLQRNNAGRQCWVGQWELMIAYKTKTHDAMMMPTLGEMLYPVAAGPIRGNHYYRLLANPKKRIATRNILDKAQNQLDQRAVGTNTSNREACNMVVNIYARTNLKLDLQSSKAVYKQGETIELNLNLDIRNGKITNLQSFARFIS